MIPAHSVHPATRWCRGRTDVNVGCGSRIKIWRRTKQHLAQVDDPPADVSSGEVLVHAFQIARKKHSARQDGSPESRSETLDLIFDSFEHMDFRPIRNVTVRPCGVLAGRRAR